MAHPEDAPRRHRGEPIPAQGRPGFGAVLRDNPREAVVTVLGVVIGVGWGADLLVSGPAGPRLLGLLGVLGGLLLGASYLLRFDARYLRDPRWSSSRTRRALRPVLAHGWVAFFAAYLVGGLILVIVQR